MLCATKFKNGIEGENAEGMQAIKYNAMRENRREGESDATGPNIYVYVEYLSPTDAKGTHPLSTQHASILQNLLENTDPMCPVLFNNENARERVT